MRRLVRGRPPRVMTAKGSVRTTKVIPAMNARDIGFGELRKGIVVVSSDMVSTHPVLQRLQAIGWTDGLCITDGRALVNCCRTTKAGRVILGKGGMNCLGAIGCRAVCRRKMSITVSRRKQPVRQPRRNRALFGRRRFLSPSMAMELMHAAASSKCARVKRFAPRTLQTTELKSA